jgi:hypothetical protein
MAGRGSRRERARYSGATSARQGRGEEILPQAPQRVPICSACHHYGYTEELRRGEAGDSPWGGTSAASLSQSSRGEFASADTPAGAAHARVQVAGSRAALPLRVWTDRPTFPPTTPPASCPRVPPRHGPTISDLVRSDSDYRRITVRSPWGYVASCPRSTSTCNKLTTPDCRVRVFLLWSMEECLLVWR